jgi:SPP1 family predicted phage head-tail adaptor
MENLERILPIASLDELVTIEQASETRNAYGEVVKTWATLATVWAKVEDTTGVGGNKEAFSSEKPTAFSRLKITIRYRGDINPGMRIVTTAGEVLDIVHVAEPWGRKRFELITADLRQ